MSQQRSWSGPSHWSIKMLHLYPRAPTGLQSRVEAQGLPQLPSSHFAFYRCQAEDSPGAVPASSARSARPSTVLPTVVTCMANSALTSSQGPERTQQAPRGLKLRRWFWVSVVS